MKLGGDENNWKMGNCYSGVSFFLNYRSLLVSLCIKGF